MKGYFLYFRQGAHTLASSEKEMIVLGLFYSSFLSRHFV
jgi:hypothetical protein